MTYNAIHGRVLGWDQSGLLFNKMPIGIPVAGKGKIFWVDSVSGRPGASALNPLECEATMAAAVTKCTTARGDIIVALSTHAEDLASATALAIAKANITIIGLGNGRARPTLTFTTANTATIAVSAANVTFRNFRFVANFLSIAAAITLTTATGFRCEQCAFHDTSGVLNFLNAIKSTGAANTIDGIHIEGCKWLSRGTTSVNTLLLSANDIDDAVLLNNRVTYQTTVDQAGLLVLTAGVPTNLLVQGNFIYRKNTTTANGSLVAIGGTVANATGFIIGNYVQTLTTTADKLTPASTGLAFFENRVSGVVNATGFVIPGADS